MASLCRPSRMRQRVQDDSPFDIAGEGLDVLCVDAFGSVQIAAGLQQRGPRPAQARVGGVVLLDGRQHLIRGLELPFPAKKRAQFQQEPRLVRRDFRAFREDRPGFVAAADAAESDKRRR